MTGQVEFPGSSRPPRSQRRRVGWTIRITPTGILLLAVINLVVLGGLAYGITRAMKWLDRSGQLNSSIPSETPAQFTPSLIPATLTPTSLPAASATEPPALTSTPVPATASPQPLSTLVLNQGLIILALNEGGNTHLFVYQPDETGSGQPLPLTRLTYGPWDDISPSFSPDAKTVAFASNRSGYWDIYLLDLASANISRLTDTLEYDAAPSWSPDNQWLVYETYLDENLELKIQSVSTPGEVVRLTNNPAADFNPVWSPGGRQIAFVSNRSGEDEIWLADLDKSEEERFLNISQDPINRDFHPAWSPDGESLVWVGEKDSLHNLFLQQLPSVADGKQTPATVSRRYLGSGDWPAWSADGEIILTTLQTPNRTYLTAYPTHNPGLALPALELPGSVNGISWGRVSLPTTIQVIYQPAAVLTSTPLFFPGLSFPPDGNGGRYQLSPLPGVVAPNPYLHDMVDESFLALRSKVAFEAGWDFLASLENAYVSLTAPLDPGMGNDWLYTGRAFTFNPLPINAGWLVIVREDFGSETYWRVYLKARFQDGSAGIPLHDQPWNFDSRYSGNTTFYEQGGALQATIPAGYWIDFTERALSYGWERMPALVTWRAFYPAARFNEFVSTGGLDWQTAMLELYPPEALITPTQVIPPTRTPTRTPRWFASPTPAVTATPRPTFTPGQVLPSLTPTPGG